MSDVSAAEGNGAERSGGIQRPEPKGSGGKEKEASVAFILSLIGRFLFLLEWRSHERAAAGASSARRYTNQGLSGTE